MTNATNRSIPQLFKKLREEYSNVCNHPNCKVTKGLEFAHICPTCVNGRGRGRKERYYDIKRNPHAYVLLCKFHHAEYDRIAQWDQNVLLPASLMQE